MPTSLSSEAFLPCLLDRLTDEEPEQKRESSYRQAFTLSHLRQSVLRDLSWLMNTPSGRLGEDTGVFLEIPSSVLNYGTPDFTGKTASSVNPRVLEAEIAEAIRRFEPRILPDTLSVLVVPAASKVSPNTIAFEIRGFLWANPMPEQFFLQSTLDLETGLISTE